MNTTAGMFGGDASRNVKEKRSDDIFSKGPNRTVINDVTQANN